MEEIKAKIIDLKKKVSQALQSLDLVGQEKKLVELKEQMSASDFWQDQEKAKTVSSQASFLSERIDSWQELSRRLSDLSELAQDKQAEDLTADISQTLADLTDQFDSLSRDLYLTGKYDNSPAIVTINAGAGGVDAQDWAAMLERMYLRLSEQQNWSVSILSRSAGSEAGIKSVTFKVAGSYAYGLLKNEAGVHRLVRLSPYDADNARHTSFAMVEVLPELSQVDFELKDEDLKIDTFRASGHGGQSVNKSSSAVRITHLPTGISVSCQNERSQLQNKKQAMSHLIGKLYRYYQAEKEEERKMLKGEYTEAAWGNQIRSYVLHPYKMVKDHRTKMTSQDPERVLDGDLMPFIKANLEKNVSAI